MKQIFKSIFGRKNRFLALFIEIVIVTVIGWMIIEPVAVNTTIAMLPAGYDYDRLVMLTVAPLEEKSPKYDPAAESGDQMSHYANLLRMVKEYPGVEKATYTSWQSFDFESMSSNQIRVDSSYQTTGLTDLETHMACVHFIPNTDFFSTFGIKDTNGKPFEESGNDGRSYVVSQTVAKLFSPNESPIGKQLFEASEWYPSSKIMGVTADMPYRKGDGRTGIYFAPISDEPQYYIKGITLRLGEGVNPHTFVDEISSKLSGFRSGNIYLTHPVYMPDQRDSIFASRQRDLTQKWMIAAFFLVNVLLGVAGTFYVQCKTRIPDAGVMRAFGAPRKRIIWNIVGEALMTTFLAWLLGSIIYLIYLKFQGFPITTDSEPLTRYMMPLWYDTKIGRYSVVGGIVLIILLLTTALGAWLPARRVGKVPIVESLKDE